MAFGFNLLLRFITTYLNFTLIICQKKKEMCETLVYKHKIWNSRPLSHFAKVISDHHKTNLYENTATKERKIQPTNRNTSNFSREMPNKNISAESSSMLLVSSSNCAKSPPSLFDFVAISYRHVTI